MNHKQELDELVEIVLTENSSDLHLTPGRYPTIRVEGTLVPLVKRTVLTSEDTKAILALLVSEERFREFFKLQEIDFSYTTPRKARFRGNAFFQQGMIGIALRFVPPTVRTLADLGLPDELERFTRLRQGLFLVVGPVGHGKSTTLAAMVNMINQERAEHIITIEDPIEYLFPPGLSIIDQREVGVDTENFHTGLESMFRQDINVAMIGEMRDLETISAAVTAGETGHLVFSTLHTNNAAQTIDRIVDSFPPHQQEQIRVQLSQSLAGIFSMRLMPRISGGRVPSYELLVNTHGVANLIREGKVQEINLLVETGAKEGMIDMNRMLVELVRRGEVTAETAQLYSLNPQGLRRML
jgi:twitching motility protein PilT